MAVASSTEASLLPIGTSSSAGTRTNTLPGPTNHTTAPRHVHPAGARTSKFPFSDSASHSRPAAKGQSQLPMLRRRLRPPPDRVPEPGGDRAARAGSAPPSRPGPTGTAGDPARPGRPATRPARPRPNPPPAAARPAPPPSRPQAARPPPGHDQTRRPGHARPGRLPPGHPAGQPSADVDGSSLVRCPPPGFRSIRGRGACPRSGAHGLPQCAATENGPDRCSDCMIGPAGRPEGARSSPWTGSAVASQVYL